MKVGEASHYGENWQRYWSTLPPTPQLAFWDTTAEFAAELDLPRFERVFGSQRPVVDFGCGNGTQTRFLGKHFAQVIGVDVSQAAIDSARAAGADEIRYEVLDGMDAGAVEAFATRVGDANVYMRTVLHQMLPQDRRALARTLKRLMGQTGALYLVELSEAADAYFQELTQEAGAPPPGLARVLENGITPGLLSERNVLDLFDGYDVQTGETLVTTVYRRPGGEVASVPAFYACVRPR